MIDIPSDGKPATRNTFTYHMSESAFLLFLAERGMRPADKKEIDRIGKLPEQTKTDTVDLRRTG